MQIVKLDWKNVDWSALAGSKVAVGAIVAVITGAVSIGGHAVPFDQQSQLSEGVSQILGGISTLAAVWALFHRVTAQPETATTIIPKKSDQPPTS